MMKEHYEEMTTEAKGFYMYAKLRTCLDPTSESWDHTTMQSKGEIIKKFLTQGTTMQDIILGYSSFYIALKMVDIAKQAFDGLTGLLQYAFTSPDTGQLIVEHNKL